MPIYEYECRQCQYKMEKIQKLSDSPLVDCPECGQPELKKLISAAAFRLKGGGWYETDFKTGKKKNVSGGGDAASSSTSESSSTSSGSSTSTNAGGSSSSSSGSSSSSS